MAGAAAEDAETEYIRKITQTEVVTGQCVLDDFTAQKTTTHSPLRNINVAICDHQADSPLYCVALCLIR